MTVSLERKADGVGVIKLNRPPMNAIDPATLMELERLLAEIRTDAGVKCLIVQSEGKTFSAGADIEFLKANSDRPEALEEFRLLFHRVTLAMEDMPKIFIAAIHGHAMGGGLELALACDFRYAAEGSYKLGLPEINLGLFPGGGATQRLARLVGRGRALHLVISGELITPARALELGIVDRVVPADALQSEMQKLAAKLAAGPTQAIGAAKLAIYQGLDAPLRAGLDIERGHHHRVSATEDARIGLRAFLEKTRAKFTGR